MRLAGIFTASVGATARSSSTAEGTYEDGTPYGCAVTLGTFSPIMKLDNGLVSTVYFLQAGCPPCRPIKSTSVLNATKKTNSRNVKSDSHRKKDFE